MKKTENILIVVVLALGLVGGWWIVNRNHSTATKENQATLKAEVAAPVEQPPAKDELLRLVNEERARAGVAPLVSDELLNQSAQYKAQDMLDRNYFDHKDPSTGLNNGLRYAREHGKECPLWISENITDNVTDEDNTSAQAIRSWKNSEPHYKAMIDPRYETTGFGIAGTKIVQHFCDEK